jgi:hypothetical protein
MGKLWLSSNEQVKKKAEREREGHLKLLINQGIHIMARFLNKIRKQMLNRVRTETCQENKYVK